MPPQKLDYIMTGNMDATERADHACSSRAAQDATKLYVRRGQGPMHKPFVPHVTRGKTDTMAAPGEYQNMLQAQTHPHTKTGYKDMYDHCNRTDKRNGGDFRRFDSTYRRSFCSVDDKPVQFREDGLPISAHRVAGKPLMAPKLPSRTELAVGKQLARRNNQTQLCIGNPDRRDPGRFKSIYSLVHAVPHRALAQPNPGIAAEDARRAHEKVGLHSKH